MINHPNFHYAIDASGLVDLAHRGAVLVEIWNQHPLVDNSGDADHPSTEALWDEVLTRGVTLWGVATDDAHHYDDARDYPLAKGRLPATGNKAWVVVRARKQMSSIRDALARGDFYSSTGVRLDRVERTGDSLLVSVVDEGAAPYRIRFIGPGGRLLGQSEGTVARHAAPDGGYVRAEIVDSRGRRAWVQPAR